ncbi:ankyrin repeat domain-containing protein [Parahaliea maris]|uniref:Ankyrin repeat domain-containing protein n=1 Tax=Parahaliea maris TaxID=2716870 RepID=A0A5C9A9C4_9GAMM|nr:ankyrin repeat domain-containing protein [Parahaliea maris]TXS95851.1 ankyrin repeat domain-containing protein [Parahaliea maris]
MEFEALRRLRADIIATIGPGNKPEMEALFQRTGPVNLDFWSPQGDTPLSAAVQCGDEDICVLLLALGADPDLRSLDDRTPLMHAVLACDTDLVRCLLRHGADVNVASATGFTPLACAALKELPGMVEWLLEEGADATRVDVFGIGPMDLAGRDASTSASRACKRLLRRHGAKKQRLGRARAAIGSGFVLPDSYFNESKQLSTSVAHPVRHIVFAGTLLAFMLSVAYGPSLVVALIISLWSLRTALRPRRQETLVDAAPNAVVHFHNANMLFIERIHRIMGGEIDLNPTVPDPERTFNETELRRSQIFQILVMTFIFVGGLVLGDNLATDGLSIVLGFVIASCDLGLKAWRLRKIKGFLREDQKIHDQRAQQIVEEQLAGESAQQGFLLYLRAFSTTGKLKSGDLDFETALALGEPRSLPLVALGGPGEHIGAGRALTTESNWRNVVLGLMDASTAIFIVPSLRGGTMWEMLQIREKHYLHKTIFILPPAQDPDKQRTKWQNICDEVVGFAIEFPGFREGGLMFTIGQDGFVAANQPFVGLQEWDVASEEGVPRY